MRSSLTISTGVALALLGATAGQTKDAATCKGGVVSKDGRSFPITAILEPRHYCAARCPDETSQPELCQNVIDLVLPGGMRQSQSDLISIPHRGAWGLGYPLSRTESENTLGAFKKAVTNNWNYLEVDVALTGPDSLGKPDVFVGHYFDMVALGSTARSLPQSYSPSQFSQLRMRTRDQRIGTRADAAVMLIGALIEWAKLTDTVLLIDPKVQRTTATENEYEHIIAIVLQEARRRNSLQNIVIKTTDSYSDAVSKMRAWIPQDEYEQNFRGRFLWNPIAEVFEGTRSQADVLRFIDDWISQTKHGIEIATVELGLFHPTDWSTNPFTWKGVRYQNIIDYLDQGNNIAHKRVGIWHIDPMTPRGTFGLKYSAQMIGNTALDQRGNIPVFLKYYGIMTVAVTTNRPDVWDSLED